jgi:hypothetical protein
MDIPLNLIKMRQEQLGASRIQGCQQRSSLDSPADTGSGHSDSNDDQSPGLR